MSKIISNISKKIIPKSDSKINSKANTQKLLIGKIPKKIRQNKIEIVKTFCCTAQVRYHQEMINCQVKILSNGNSEVEFQQPVRAVALGQSVVFYDGEIMLGGGIIDQKLD